MGPGTCPAAGVTGRLGSSRNWPLVIKQKESRDCAFAWPRSANHCCTEAQLAPWQFVCFENCRSAERSCTGRARLFPGSIIHTQTTRPSSSVSAIRSVSTSSYSEASCLRFTGMGVEHESQVLCTDKGGGTMLVFELDDPIMPHPNLVLGPLTAQVISWSAK